jgi:hypothetical protein
VDGHAGQVRRWRRSGRVARQIAVALERGDEPLPAAADGVPETIVAGMS